MSVPALTTSRSDDKSDPRRAFRASCGPGCRPEAAGPLGSSGSVPDGRPTLPSSESSPGHDFTILDSRCTEVAKVHERWLDLRDSHALELLGDLDPFAPAVLALILDRAEQARRARR